MDTIEIAPKRRRAGSRGKPEMEADLGLPEPGQALEEAGDAAGGPETPAIPPAAPAGGKRRDPLIPIPPDQELLEVRQVAHMCHCSVRNVWRKSDAGKMPAPVQFDGKTLWVRQHLREWMTGGCKPLR